MKHMSDSLLNSLEPLLAEIRELGRLAERKRGVFYYKSQAFLHFHEDPVGMFADLRSGAGWVRFLVDTADQQRDFMRTVRSRL